MKIDNIIYIICNGSGYVAEKDYPTVSYRFLSTV